jgi:hypothetical protein
MLKQDTINKLAVLAKIKPEDLLAAIKAEAETDITIDDKLTVFSEDEVTTLKDNEYKRGKTVGVEMAVKDTKEKLGLEFQGKTVEGLVEAANKKAIADAKVNPDQKVVELTEKITTLQKTVGDQEKQLQAKEAEVTGVKVKGELYKHIPQAGENDPAVGADDVIQLMMASGYEFKFEEGKLIPYKDGKQLQDKTANALPADSVVKDFVKEKKLRSEGPGVPGGRGGQDNKPPTAFSKLSDVKKSFEAQNKSVLGQEFSEAVQKAATDNKEFDMNS